MADVGNGINRVIQVVDGEAATVTSGKLDVNATLVAGASIDIGDVEILGHGTFTCFAQDTSSTSAQTITALIPGAAQTDCKEIIIQADFDNASFIMVGDSNVSSDDTIGIRLHAGDMLVLPVTSTENVSVRAPDGLQKLNISILK